MFICFPFLDKTEGCSVGHYWVVGSRRGKIFVVSVSFVFLSLRLSLGVSGDTKPFRGSDGRAGYLSLPSVLVSTVPLVGSASCRLLSVVRPLYEVSRRRLHRRSSDSFCIQCPLLSPPPLRESLTDTRQNKRRVRFGSEVGLSFPRSLVPVRKLLYSEFQEFTTIL